jgi:hypothetical protein
LLDLRRAAPAICVVSGGERIQFASHINHAIYARENGYDYRLQIGLSERARNGYFLKIAAVERFLPLYDWVLWVDDDAFFTDFDGEAIRRLITEAEADRQFLVAARQIDETPFNTGVMLLQSVPAVQRLLRRTIEADPLEVELWWDPKVDGVSISSDQEALWWAISKSGLRSQVRIVEPRALNALPDCFHGELSDLPVVHFYGSLYKKLRIAEFGRRWGYGNELVPEHLLEAHGVRTREETSTLQFGSWRFKRWCGHNRLAQKLKWLAGGKARAKRISDETQGERRARLSGQI